MFAASDAAALIAGFAHTDPVVDATISREIGKG